MRQLTHHESNGILLGMTLGDSYLRCRNGRTYMETVHAKRNTDYLEWKRSLLSHLPGEIKPKSQYRKGKLIESSRWYVPVTATLNNLYNDFYVNGRKIVKRSVLNRLTQYGLAIWYMDDGHLELRRDGQLHRIILSTQGFDDLSNQIITQWFQDKLQIEAKQRNQRDIKITFDNAREFIRLVKPVVDQVESMRYKVAIDVPKIEANPSGYVWQLPSATRLRTVIQPIGTGPFDPLDQFGSINWNGVDDIVRHSA